MTRRMVSRFEKNKRVFSAFTRCDTVSIYTADDRW